MFKRYLDSQQLNEWHNLVDSAKRIVIVGHTSPDGDALGASLALWHWLKGKNKDVTVVMPNMFPDFLKWLPGANEVIQAATRHAATRQAFNGCDLVMCMDFNGLGRLDNLEHNVTLSGAKCIMIDHHLCPEPFAALSVSDAKACSTCEIVFYLLWQLGDFDDLTEECATCLYCGMMTDTGGFTYNSTRPEIYSVIAQLLTKGIDKDKIYRNVYHNYSVDRMRLVGYVLDRKMEYFSDLHASLLTLTKEEMTAYHFIKGDAEGLVNMPLEIKDTKLSISLREDTEKPLVRVSLRSVDGFPCNKMAEQFFNGGGHLNASGGSLAMSMEDAVVETKKALEAYRDLLADSKNVENA